MEEQSVIGADGADYAESAGIAIAGVWGARAGSIP
jgi:hypothetical protein